MCIDDATHDPAGNPYQNDEDLGIAIDDPHPAMMLVFLLIPVAAVSGIVAGTLALVRWLV